MAKSRRSEEGSLPAAVRRRLNDARLGLLALLIPAAIVAPPLLLSAGTTAVLIVVVTWEWVSLRQRA